MSTIKIIFSIALVMTAVFCFPSEPTASIASRTTDLVKPFEAGEASYYSYECADLPMANGKPFDPEKRTCASWFYPFGTVLSVQSLENGLVTQVTVTDRGPNKRLVKKGRVIDLSKRAFEDICDLDKGLTRVIITPVVQS